MAHVHEMVRQAHKYTDFLILLVNRTNSAILDGSRSRWLQIALLYEQSRNAAFSSDETADDWVGRLQELATELFSLQAASDQIRDKYFDGQCILLEDAREDMEQQIKVVQAMVRAYDHAMLDAGQPEFASDPQKSQKAARELAAAEKASYIVALARSKMLQDFGEGDAANSVLRPYILNSD